MSTYTHAAGRYEQDADSPTGWATVTLSRHRSHAAALKAARGYARRLMFRGPSTGGAYTWSAWWAPVGGAPVEVRAYRANGEYSYAEGVST